MISQLQRFAGPEQLQSPPKSWAVAKATFVGFLGESWASLG